jgi:hypothetical protein
VIGNLGFTGPPDRAGASRSPTASSPPSKARDRPTRPRQRVSRSPSPTTTSTSCGPTPCQPPERQRASSPGAGSRGPRKSTTRMTAPSGAGSDDGPIRPRTCPRPSPTTSRSHGAGREPGGRG